jgi:two-component system chemotaxis response regulator CheY
MNLTKVLIVDDAAFMRMTIKMMLEKNGFEVAGEAENGKVAIRKYIECKPDIVTMDITMPEMGGIDALKEIMKLDPNAKVVMISAMGQERMVLESVMAGAKTFIVKPFKEEHVIETLTKVAAS